MRCFYCGVTLTKENKTKDHFIPQSRGGKGYMGNKVDACLPCNKAKADLSLEDFKKTKYYIYFCKFKAWQ